jgi:hypothetical protein
MRLEQGRAANPSSEMVEALARALRLFLTGGLDVVKDEHDLHVRQRPLAVAVLAGDGQGRVLLVVGGSVGEYRDRQAALICGLTVHEFREMQALEAIPKPHSVSYFNRGRRTRTPDEQGRLDELDASPRGATGANQRQTYKLRAHYLSMLKVHHSAKTDLTHAREDQAAMDATAQPPDPGTAAELKRVTADLDEANKKFDERAGYASATAEIPARNGGALVVEAIQEQEGGVRYKVDRKPADPDEEWSVEPTATRSPPPPAGGGRPPSSPVTYPAQVLHRT